MATADGLFLSLLEQPEDDLCRAALADWLEEQDDATSLTQAELLRMQGQWLQLREFDPERVTLETQATALAEQFPGLVGPLQHYVGQRLGLLESGIALVTVVASTHVNEVEKFPEPGLEWHGSLSQGKNRLPLIWEPSTQQGNTFRGTMTQDFFSLYHYQLMGKFWFDGVAVAKRYLVFATYRGVRGAAVPGLYTGQIKPGGWMVGDWQVSRHFKGTFRARRRRTAS